jgi:Spy/CpxP family protein refolding chaperone
MKKIMLISILSLFLFGILCMTFAQEQEATERPLKRIREERIVRVFNDLNLTEKQEDELAKLRLENRKEMIKLRAELQTLQLDLQALLEPREPDKAKVYAQLDKINKLKNEMAKMRIENSLQRRAILTDEQWNKIKKSRRFHHFDRFDQQSQGARHLFPRFRDGRFMERRWEPFREN